MRERITRDVVMERKSGGKKSKRDAQERESEMERKNGDKER